MNAILQQLSTLHPGPGEIALCRLGQHSFLIRIGDSTIAVDPYLSEDPKRLIPPLIRAGKFSGMDLILCTHDHGDHLDRNSLAAMAEASPDALFVVPEAVRPSIREIPQERLCGMNDGETRHLRAFSISAVASAHEFLDRTSDGLYPHLGYVIGGRGVAVYHSGDCCVYEGLLSRLRKQAPDIMLLPINGRDAWRYAHGCIGCMTWQEAADLAGWVGTSYVVPAHYDMFEGNTADPVAFCDYVHVKYPLLKSRILQPGEIVILHLRGGT